MKKHLTLIAQRADLNNPEEVETAIARYTCVDIHTKKPTNRPATNNFKTKLCSTYKGYCTLNKIQWEKPTYTKEEHSIQPPTQERCNQLIASAKGEMSLKIDVSTQTGLRPIEVTGEKGIKGKDIHPDQNTITAMVTKGCNQRPPLKITPELTARLQAHITRHQIRPEQPLFKGSSKTYTCHFIRLKHTLAKKLNDPSILSIRLYDLRHAYITKQLRRTQNTESVRQLIGHKQLNTTQKYLHLLADQSGEWTVEGTTDKNRAIQLITQDYIYVNTTPDGTMIYKKAK